MVYYTGMSKDYAYRNFVTTAEIDAYLEARAKRDDRSVSAVIRIILQAEMQRDPVSVNRENGHRKPR